MPMSAIIKASFADYRRVRTRKVAQLVFEVPLEQLHQAVERLGGEPASDGSTWVAIARLIEGEQKEDAQPDAVSTQPPAASGAHKKFSELRPSAQAALLGGDKQFWIYLYNQYDELASSEAAAAGSIRYLCGVQSRSKLDSDPDAAAKWKAIFDGFQAWRIAVGHGAAA